MEDDHVIVDFHVHVGGKDMTKPHIWEWMEEFIEKGSGLKDVLEGDEINPGLLARLLRTNRVNYAVCLSEYSPITTGVTTNEYVSRFCLYDDMFIPFCNVNPYLSKSPKDELKYCLDELGFMGIKLYPTYQHFYPNESVLYPLYELAEERQIPVMSHTGSSVFPGAKIKYGDPIYWDDVAVDFPNLNILLVHSGRGFWYDRASFLAQLHNNIYLEIAGLPPKNLLNYIPKLEKLSDKVIFGSDWPVVPGIGSNISDIENLPISKEAKKNILGKNAVKLLKLDKIVEGESRYWKKK